MGGGNSGGSDMSEQNLGSKYVIDERLGSGAMGTVYRGRDHEGHAYAFKVLRSDLAEEPELVQRFVQERSSLTAVEHPNVVAMHDLVVEGSTLAIVMDLVPGTDLRQTIREAGALPPSEVARIGAGIAAGLAAVHRAGIVHRDIKPENVLLDSSVRPPIPRVTDFGIARIADASAATRSSMMLGTPNYMAPEVAEGTTPTPGVDVYGLGVILYELCCGVTPFEGGSFLAVLKRHAELAPGRPHGIPDELWDAIVDMLSKDPATRPSAQQLVQYLTALTQKLDGVPAAPAVATPPAVLAAETERTPRADTVAGGSTAPVDHPSASRRRSPVRVMVGLGLAAVVAAAVWWTMLRDDGTAVASGTDGPVVTAETTPTPTPGVGNDTEDAAPASTPGSPSEAAASTVADDLPSETTSQSTTTPDVVGLTLSAARAELRGTEVTVLEEFDESAKDNEVLAQSVPTGQDLPDEIELTVARQPVTIYLDDMEDVEGDWYLRPGRGQISGEPYPRSLTSASHTDEVSGSWNLGRGFRELRATLGRSDEASNTETEIQVEIFLDRRKVHTEIVGFGEPVDLKVDVADALRLQVVAKSLDGEAMNLVLGDIRLLGLPGEVPELDEE